jgi:NitT/TauT family transport system substrate-binding protein
MKMNRRGLIEGLGLLALAPILSRAQPTASAPAEKIVLRTDFPPVPIHAGLFLAQVKGWWKEAGIDMEIQDGRGSTNTIQLVGAGQIDVAYVSLGPIMPAREAGMKIKSFAAVTHKSDLGLVYDPRKGIRTMKDLQGKTLLCFTGSTWTPFIEPFLKSAGLDPKTVTILNIDVNAMWTSYQAGQGDGVLSIPPFGMALVEANRPSRAFLAADYGVPLLGYGLVAREETIAARAPVLAKVAQVVARAWNYIYEGHEEEAVEAIPKARPDVKLNPDVTRKALKFYKEYFYTPESTGKPLWLQQEREWSDALKTQESAGLIKAGHRIDEFYTNDVVKNLK